MDNPLDVQMQRPVRVQTPRGVVEGYLNSSSMIRLLDDLNVVNHAFRTIQSPVVDTEGWEVEEDGPLAVHRDSILFVMEREDAPPLPADRPGAIEAARHTRAAMRLWVGEFVIEGFVHVAPGGTPLSRLFHSRHPFMALSSATVIGPGGTIETPFIAVNRSHVTSAQELDRDPPPLEDTSLDEIYDDSGIVVAELQDDEREPGRVQG
jgi:hypothetical protein